MQTILITGASGFLGQRLVKQWAYQFRIHTLTRSPFLVQGAQNYLWNPENKTIDFRALEGVDVVVHLAGDNVGQGRWTQDKKDRILRSRTEPTLFLQKALASAGTKLTKVVAVSGTGYYGDDSGLGWVDENAAKGQGFLADVVEQWEKASQTFASICSDVTILRLGVVLDQKEGAFPLLSKPFRLGLGAAIGSGKQGFSWVHVNDVVGIFNQAVLGHIGSGIHNVVAPGVVSNLEFSKLLAKKLGYSLWLPAVPEFVLQLALGEKQVLATGGNYVKNTKIPEKFFAFPTLETALNELVGKKI